MEQTRLEYGRRSGATHVFKPRLASKIPFAEQDWQCRFPEVPVAAVKVHA